MMFATKPVIQAIDSIIDDAVAAAAELLQPLNADGGDNDNGNCCFIMGYDRRYS